MRSDYARKIARDTRSRIRRTPLASTISEDNSAGTGRAGCRDLASSSLEELRVYMPKVMDADRQPAVFEFIDKHARKIAMASSHFSYLSFYEIANVLPCQNLIATEFEKFEILRK